MTNRLKYIHDTVPEGNYPNVDLDSQNADNYAYDEIGNLIRDEAEGIEQIEWTVDGKVKQITKSNGDELAFQYNPSRHRITKIFTPAEGPEKTTYYVRDAAGQILSIYTFETTESTTSLVQQEVPIMGASRIGVYRPDVNTDVPDDPFERRLGEKAYELTDHLGNVRVTVSDIKLSELTGTEPPVPQNFTADMTSYNNYFPFGMEMPKRSFSSSDYRHGFNGMEKDDEVKGSGNSYTTTARLYDPRVGRWLSVDPILLADSSPFNGFADNPIRFIDPTGTNSRKRDMYQESQRFWLRQKADAVRQLDEDAFDRDLDPDYRRFLEGTIANAKYELSLNRQEWEMREMRRYRLKHSVNPISQWVFDHTIGGWFDIYRPKS